MTPEYERAMEIGRAIKELRANPMFAEFLAVIAQMEAAETGAHEDESRTPYERAEHICAMKRLRELRGWLDSREITNARKLRPTP